MMTATYSPEDNKLRLYPSSRLDPETYARVKAAGFSWAPKQELFVAPAWTPSREDLLLELCGDIDDEDTSLVDRAAQRAERFEDYSDKRGHEAESARKAVAAIADGIPFGQPILVGHHSEKHARRDAEKIQNGMSRAVKLWKTSQYWEQRAAGALRHAKYKELPSVRARRIKTLEAEARRILRAQEKREACRGIWERCKDLKQARFIAGNTEAGYLSCCKHPALDQYLHPSDVLPFEDRSDYAKANYPTWTLEQVKERAADAYKVPGPDSDSTRWLEHLKNRITYERAMIGEAGGLVSDRTKPEKGGACQCWATPRGGWSLIVKVNKVSVTLRDTWSTAESVEKCFTRNIPFDKLRALMSPADVQAARQDGRVQREDARGFYLSAAPTPKEPPTCPEDHNVPHSECDTCQEEAKADLFGAMEKSLRAGVQVVSAPQLFPTPPDVAARLVELAEIDDTQRVLEPSAGTGNILQAIGEGPDQTAIEINFALAERLRAQYPGVEVRCSDFLECNGNLGTFDRIVMNPPFENGADIKHIRHALAMLRPGGKLVAICANGPRQQAALQPEADAWIELDSGTFAGTNVRAAIVVMSSPA